MNQFKEYHPIVNFTYFVFVIGFSMFFMHPVCLIISLACGFTYLLLIKGKKALKAGFTYILPLMLAMAIINPVFNHEGMTIIKYFPGGNPLTMESVVYGFAAAGMIVSVIFWFSCYNEVMTSDKFIYLFGRIIPSLSLIFSMTLRFVPRFTTQLRMVANAQKCIGKDVSRGNILSRVKNALSVLSVMATWALESSVETADSMKSRGYGLPGRTAFSVFGFDKRDGKALACIVALGAYVFVGNLNGGMYFNYFPRIESVQLSWWSATVFAAYFALCILPVIIEIKEVRRWKALKSKI